MTVLEGPRGQAGGGMLLIVVLAIAVLMCAAVGSVPAGQVGTGASTHAVARHGTDAQVALQMVQKDGDCRECSDGRRRCTASEGSRWAVAVYEMVGGTWRVVTSFLCDQDYANSVKDGCDGRWRGVHP